MRKLISRSFIGLLAISTLTAFAGECDSVKTNPEDEIIKAYKCDLVRNNIDRNLHFTKGCLIKAIDNGFYSDGDANDSTYVKFQDIDDPENYEVRAFKWAHKNNTPNSKYKETRSKILLKDYSLGFAVQKFVTKIQLNKNENTIRVQEYYANLFTGSVNEILTDADMSCTEL